ncbi:unnamed protein product [Sphagnum jensenii]|uniref:Uncharacterized protein n=1 Tax=Sphagnum jensenii TaxID=128206 RepID=A0ABP1A504_9BRYO
MMRGRAASHSSWMVWKCRVLQQILDFADHFFGWRNGCNDDEVHGETELEKFYSSDIDCLILESAVMAKEFGAGESGHGHLLVLLRMEAGKVFILFMTCMVECRSSQMTNQ